MEPASCTTADLASEKRDSERRFSRSLVSVSSSGEYNSSTRTSAECILMAATGVRNTVVGFWPGEWGPVFIPGNARLGSQRRVRRLTAAGIDSCTFLFRRFRILPGVVDVTRGCATFLARVRAFHIPFELVSGARTRRAEAASRGRRVFREFLNKCLLDRDFIESIAHYLRVLRG